MRITEIQLLSNDLDATAKFYADLLGFDLTHRNKERVSFTAGASALTFILSDAIIPIYHFAFNIPPESLHEALLWTKQRTDIIPVEHGEEIADFASWNAKAFYFHDNNGNILEFIARYNLSHKTNEAFCAQSLLSISEIAIVVDDVAATCNRMAEAYGIDIFAGTKLDNFAAMGSDEGLFIISQAGREWYSSHTKAQSAWSTTSFEAANKQYELVTE